MAVEIGRKEGQPDTEWSETFTESETITDGHLGRSISIPMLSPQKLLFWIAAPIRSGAYRLVTYLQWRKNNLTGDVSCSLADPGGGAS